MTEPGPMRVLVVGFVGSIHAVRAVQPMVELGWDVHVFAAHPHWADSAWRGVTLHLDPGFDPPELDPSVRVERLEPPEEDPEPVVDGLSWRQRVAALTALVEELRPDLVDSMEIQHGGYLMLEARQQLASPSPPWLVHNWGSDVFYYGRNPRHVSRLRAVLSGCDFYGAECHRDVGLARGFGFSGRALPVLPNPGGFDLERARSLRPSGPSSERRTIALKATNFFVYRPRTALAALERCGDLLNGYRLALYTATEDIEREAAELCEAHGMELEVVSRASAPVAHEEILRMHGAARVSISLSESDAICTAFLEAMLMGSFPVQSETGCAAAWAEDGSGALFVDPDDPDQVAAALRRALGDDALVDAAAEQNAVVAASRLDRRLLLARAMDIYERLAVEIRGGTAADGLDPVAMAASLQALAEPCGCGGSGVRREQLAMLMLDPGGPPPRARDLLDPGAGVEEWAGLAEDLVWTIGRQAEIGTGQALALAAASGEKDATENWYDGELRERDDHIAALRRHVKGLQGSLDGFHRGLEAQSPPPSPVRRLARRLLSPSVRARLRRLANRSSSGREG